MKNILLKGCKLQVRKSGRKVNFIERDQSLTVTESYHILNIKRFHWLWITQGIFNCQPL